VVLLLATAATTAAGVTPAYMRAAQESVLRDLAVLNPLADLSLNISAAVTPATLASRRITLEQAASTAKNELSRRPMLQSVVSGTASHVETNLKLANQVPGVIVTGQYVYRAGVCEQVVVTGRCPSAPGEVMVSTRSAEKHNVKLGEPVPVSLGSEADQGRSAKAGGAPQDASPAAAAPIVTGLYTPKDPADRYWTLGSLLSYTPEGDIHLRGTFWSLDAVFAGVAKDIEGRTDSVIRSSLVYWLNLDAIRMVDVEALDTQTLSFVKTLESAGITASSGLLSVLKEVRTDQEEIGTTVPIGAVPLLVLAVAVLMVLVAALTEERGPEIALAKLHGYRRIRVSTFGLGEVLFLILAAAPAGLALGWLTLFVMAKLWLAQGIPVALPWQSLASVAVCLLVASVAAVVASRKVISTRIINLLRRVPQRAGWRASAFEGAAAALALAALYTAWQDRESSLALLAPPLLAIVLGIAGGRIVSVRAGGQLRRARRRANVTGMITGAALSRRPGRVRIFVVVAVATSLMGFAATTWDASSQARAEAAGDMVGAHTVYTVSAAGPEKLIAAVNAAAPDGSAMAVVRRQEYYAGDTVQVVGVQSDRFANVATWYGHTREDLSTVAGLLRPSVPQPFPVSGRLAIKAEVTGVGDFPLELAVDVRTGSDVKRVNLGRLLPGAHEYSGTVPDGLLSSLNLIRPPANPVPINGSFIVQAITSDKGPQELGTAESWQPTVAAGSKAGVVDGPGLRVDFESTGNGDIRITRLRSPKIFPVVLAGAAPHQNRDPSAPWNFMAFSNQPQPFQTARTEHSVPGVFGHGYLADLEGGLDYAMDTAAVTDLTYVYLEVWANASAPADLVQRLGTQGIQVSRKQTLTGYTDQLARRAPALSLRFYGLAGLVAVLLALGIVVLAARIGADQRRYELATLRIAGIPVRTLRRGIRREYLTLLAWPSLLGLAAGVASAIFMLPVIPLVRSGVTGSVQWEPTPWAIGTVAGAGLISLLVALPIAVSLVRQAAPDLVRDTI
jgi:ABC-type antimicrobial peptide transport system permease subunit